MAAEIKMIEPLDVTLHNIHLLGTTVGEAHMEMYGELPGLVVVPRSGYLIGDLISRQWGVQGVDMLHACVAKNEAGAAERFRVGQFPTESEVAGKRLVVLDAVRRSGETLDFVANRLLAFGAQTVEAAVLYQRVDLGDPTLYPPGYVVHPRREFTVFAWEHEEHHSVPANG